MNIEIDNHKLLTGVLTAALIGLGSFTYHKLEQIDKTITVVDNANLGQIEKNKNNIKASQQSCEDKIALVEQKLDEHIQDYILQQPQGKETE